jgi:hypothetical protein
LLVGRVRMVAMHAAGLYQTAWIDSVADLGELEYAFVTATEADLASVRPEVPENVVADGEMGSLEGEDP